MENAQFGRSLLKEFRLKEGTTFLNHGSYGSVPNEVFEKRISLLEEVESHPDLFFRVNLEPFWMDNIRAISKVLGANPDNLVFVNNTTTGINAVMRSVALSPGDEILCYTWQYRAVYNTCVYAARQKGAEVKVLDIRTPIVTTQEIVDKYDKFLAKNPKVKIAVLDYISSCPSVLMPIKELIAVCKKHNVMSMVDGAHVPGQIQINLEELGADFFAGNLHKWMFVPRGCAVLWVDPKHQKDIRPCVTSSHLDGPHFYKDFLRQGTVDDSPFHCVQESLAFIERIGGMDAIIEHNSKLADQAADLLADLLGTKKFDVPKEMESPFLRMVRLPDMKKYPARKETSDDFTSAVGDIAELHNDIMERFKIQTVSLYVHSEPWIRLSAQVYNDLEDIRKLADAILTLKAEETE
ncbi:hypothetical protein CAPTEDRAFT_225673 [Capitella teleta]|uniref:Aminotransferase class V domain-containing protein n=1 Tax=Capitella teleta TaxID=283909 RepID=R7UPD6_CAPTE|nr:hypothetical protein CAPTEDRAFT_225673 [Capitella teleta]|eukprot:ELU05271.1 hypothetical protein CAPTEDRAFT_225673 [Capitella teleta]